MKVTILIDKTLVSETVQSISHAETLIQKYFLAYMRAGIAQIIDADGVILAFYDRVSGGFAQLSYSVSDEATE